MLSFEGNFGWIFEDAISIELLRAPGPPDLFETDDLTELTLILSSSGFTLI